MSGGCAPVLLSTCLGGLNLRLLDHQDGLLGTHMVLHKYSSSQVHPYKVTSLGGREAGSAVLCAVLCAVVGAAVPVPKGEEFQGMSINNWKIRS